MVQITIDDELKQKLLATTEEVELCDADGVVVRRIAPPEASLPDGGRFTPPLPSEEELKRRLAYEGPGFSTEEVIAHLKSRP